MASTLLGVLSERKSEFIAERSYMLCRAYLIERLIPSLIAAGADSSSGVAMTVVQNVISGFLASDHRRATPARLAKSKAGLFLKLKLRVPLSCDEAL